MYIYEPWTDVMSFALKFKGTRVVGSIGASYMKFKYSFLQRQYRLLLDISTKISRDSFPILYHSDIYE